MTMPILMVMVVVLMMVTTVTCRFSKFGTLFRIWLVRMSTIDDMGRDMTVYKSRHNTDYYHTRQKETN